MYLKILISTTIIILIIGCSTFKQLVYYSNINQGNYITKTDMDKIYIGMTQEQVIYTLGTPIIQDPFGSSTWFYVFRQQLGHAVMSQRILTITFDNKGFLVKIKKDY
ncbi:outer membrane protein assembly factor BamE [Candidatus Profftia sp. (ex Adelges kitamiensis)]|uniref:outer membrane protein assembly factor BamE n=1 Tax=Candidatus Profftia sp. (ex Adelges kitamiensis) TaxID=2864218 RepID=UPI001CE32E34|nr:outer membrane protein assembly factor BamE [Candidatus Profftia sp. (ex Adelges kitamiensis)]